ncbi:hypothetical protein [Avibacterium paragallinarum]|uniref:hypothetical protein n=1 Tax=Avibacterium paragallinarum TaxID=728 RepID=UPI00188F1656|nr:hypothetical protein [Avibacterium paragallinarum]QZP16526.1 hypothetical protein K5O18_04235 [Avibacterium paragallinarum]
MIDVKDTILKFKLERAKNYISIVNLLDFIKSSNPTVNFAEIVDCLLIKLKENNPRTTTQYDSYEKIYTYRLPINLEESIQECSDCFFEILESVRSAFLDHMDCLIESRLGNLCPDQPYLNEGAAEAIGRLAVNFIPENDCFVAISKPQIERLLGFKIPLDGEITQSETTRPRKDNLETQITQLDQSAEKNEAVLVGEEKYNPTERETHLLTINALVNIITRPDFKAGTANYLKANGINQSAIYREITKEITRILNAPETNERSEETIKRRLKEAMELETKQAD